MAEVGRSKKCQHLRLGIQHNARVLQTSTHSSLINCIRTVSEREIKRAITFAIAIKRKFQKMIKDFDRENYKILWIKLKGRRKENKVKGGGKEEVKKGKKKGGREERKEMRKISHVHGLEESKLLKCLCHP